LRIVNNDGKSDVYAWMNLINGRVYVGSARFLSKISTSQRLSWTPERRAAQAERARKQGLANLKNQHKIGALEPMCVVEVS